MWVPSLKLFAVASCVMSLAFWLSSYTEGESSSPGQNVDLGDVSPSSISIKRFRILNSTSAAWHVDGVTSNCTCSELAVERKLVPPGEELKGEFKVTAPSVSGDFSGAGKILMKGCEPVRLAYYGTVIPPFTLDMTKVYLHDEPVNFQCRVHVEGTRVDVASKPEWCDVSFSESSDGMMTGTIRLMSQKEHTVSGRILLESVDGYQEAIHIVSPAENAISVSPPVIYFGSVFVGDLVESSVTLRVKKREVRSDWDAVCDRNMEVEFDSISSNVTRMIVQLQADEPQMINSTITLSDDELSVDVPVSAKIIPRTSVPVVGTANQ